MARLRLLGLLTAAVTAGVIAWRRLAHRPSAPCPASLAWFLENPLLDHLLGTAETLDRLNLRPGQRVLEVGPGPGRLLVPAAQRVLPDGEVVGLDIQPGMLDRLRMRAARAGVTNLTAVLGDAAQPHFAPESFDLISFVTVLGEVPEREAALRQAYAALKPGGRLSITEMFPDPHFLSPGTVQRLARAAGFRLESIEGSRLRFTATFVKPGAQPPAVEPEGDVGDAARRVGDAGSD